MNSAAGEASALERFLASVAASGLLGPGRIRALADELAGPTGQVQPGRLAEELIARGLLTRWQVEKLRGGVQQGFFVAGHKLLRLVAAGGMGSVYEAEHVLMRRRAAIKVLPAELADEPGYRERFYREARELARLDHPHIVRGLDVGRDDGRDYLVMEFIEGRNLEEAVAEGGPLPFVEAAEYTRQAALGLERLHQEGLVHRDIKPSNLQLSAAGVVKILDLGIVLPRQREAGPSLTRVMDVQTLGTVDYLSPEQAIDSHAADSRSDLYSLGCTLHFLITGASPFSGGSLAETLLLHQTRPPSPMSARRPGVPGELEDIVARLLAKLPRDRYQSAGEVASALDRWLTRGGRSSPRPPAQRVAQERSSREAPIAPGAGPGAGLAFGHEANDGNEVGPAPRGKRRAAPSLGRAGGAACSPTSDMVDLWRRWSDIARAIAAGRRLGTGCDEAHYQAVYSRLVRICGECDAEEPPADPETLRRIGRIVTPWVTLGALKAFLAGEAGGSLMDLVHELDREMLHRPNTRRWLAALALILVATALVAASDAILAFRVPDLASVKEWGPLRYVHHLSQQTARRDASAKGGGLLRPDPTGVPRSRRAAGGRRR